ncbi:MAG: zf-TFIIB domain-containing protein [Fimbriimonadaceae bacterium]|nr:zf-TFIIB domain-containing protein [Fimbriimonadaceae bacterium]
MKCPKCEVIELTMADRAGVEIDYCSACRGVWLDRGELDKIIERTPLATPSADRFSERPPRGRVRDQDDDDDDDDRYEDRGRRKKRGGFLGELFDF